MNIGPKAKIFPVAEAERLTQFGSRTDSEMQGGGGTLGDEQAFSPDAAEVRELVARVNRLPTVRRDKVAAIKSLLQEGNYSVSPEQMAEAMISALEARDGLGVPAGEAGNNITDSEPLARQSRREFGSRTHDITAEPAPEDDEPRENSDTSHSQMDGVA